MKYDSDEALDRALFALPLEEPPSDLRAAILTATVYRPAPLFKPWEIALLGSLAAVATWLIALVVLGGGTLFVHSLQIIGSSLADAFSNYATLAWIAAGGGAAIWLSLFTGFQPAARGVNARRR
jgi:hypothetical protein